MLHSKETWIVEQKTFYLGIYRPVVLSGENIIQRKRSTDLAHGALLEQKEHVKVRKLSCILNVEHMQILCLPIWSYLKCQPVLRTAFGMEKKMCHRTCTLSLIEVRRKGITYLVQ
jgi:hypothetical protein